MLYSYIPLFQHYFPKDDAGPTTVVIGKGKLRSASLARTGTFKHEKCILKRIQLISPDLKRILARITPLSIALLVGTGLALL